MLPRVWGSILGQHFPVAVRVPFPTLSVADDGAVIDQASERCADLPLIDLDQLSKLGLGVKSNFVV